MRRAPNRYGLSFIPALCRGLSILSLLLFLAGCGESGMYTGTLILDGEHHIGGDEILPGDVVVMAGKFSLAPGAQLTGSLQLVNGEADLGGQVGGNVSQLGGTLTLQPTALIAGDLNLGGGMIEHSPQATIRGRIDRGTGLQVPDIPTSTSPISPLRRLWVGLGESILAAAAAYLLSRRFPSPLHRLEIAIQRHTMLTVASGSLAGIVLPALLVLMAFTIVLIPVTMIGILLIIVALMWGGIGLGQALGHQLATHLRRSWSAPVQATVGTATLVGFLNLTTWLPYAGALLAVICATLSLGAVMLTRFGRHNYIPPSQPPLPYDPDPHHV